MTHILVRPASKACTQLPLLCSLPVLILFLLSSVTSAQSPQPSPAPAQTSSSNSPEANAAEIVSHDETPSFKVNVNLVMVHVVVRDAKGKTIGNLKKEDFELFDNRKPQVISTFSAEAPGAKVAAMHQSQPADTENEPAQPATPAALPERYVAYVFDDVHLNFGDLAQVRNAAERHFATLRPTDRAAIFTTSGQTTLDFTDDPAKLHDTLLRLMPRPIAGDVNPDASCFQISYYMADLIENKHDQQAIQVAVQDALTCEFNNDSRAIGAAQGLVEATAQRVLSAGSAETHVTLTVLNDIIRRMSVFPGQRSMVLVSPGFLTPEMGYEYNEAVDRAVRAQVTIGAIDARGLYVVVPDISRDVPLSAEVQAIRQQYATLASSAEDDVLEILAEGTGGIFFHNNNDLVEGFRRVASTPEYSYVLGFSPQNLKLDGSFHNIKVTLKNPPKYEIQARRGYFAPKHAADPAQQAKQEIEDAVFSQEEMHSLPVDLHTQFFKASDEDAKLTVLAHIDVRKLHLRKADGRNNDQLTVVSAVFNGNGNLVQGVQKTLTMRLKDETLEKKLNSGITVKTSFDVKPGSYFVRLVVRDAEAQLVSAENDAVRIP